LQQLNTKILTVVLLVYCMEFLQWSNKNPKAKLPTTHV